MRLAYFNDHFKISLVQKAYDVRIVVVSVANLLGFLPGAVLFRLLRDMNFLACSVLTDIAFSLEQIFLSSNTSTVIGKRN